MQPRAEEIQRILTAFAEGKQGGLKETARRSTFALVVQGSTPLQATIRELRGSCAMIDIGSSIFTLAYADILGIDPLRAEEGSLRVTVRPGCFASHVAARLRRSSSRGWRGEDRGQASSKQAAVRAGTAAVSEFDDATTIEALLETEGGAASSDPTSSESARQQVVGNDVGRSRRS